MLMPSKHMPQDLSVLYLAGCVVKEMLEPTSLSVLWERVQRVCPDCSFERFVLALDFLYLVDAVSHNQSGLLVRRPAP